MSATLPPYLRQQGNEVLLAVKLQPRASRNEIGEALGSELKIKITAPPVDSAANEALVGLLAKELNCSRSQVQLIRGQTSRHKTIRVQGISIAEVARRLGK